MLSVKGKSTRKHGLKGGAPMERMEPISPLFFTVAAFGGALAGGYKKALSSGVIAVVVSVMAGLRLVLVFRLLKDYPAYLLPQDVSCIPATTQHQGSALLMCEMYPHAAIGWRVTSMHQRCVIADNNGHDVRRHLLMFRHKNSPRCRYARPTVRVHG